MELQTSAQRTRAHGLGPALGLERVGHIAVAHPRVSLALMLLVSLIAAFAAATIGVDDGLTNLFRNNSAEFRRYESLIKRFPSSEYDLLVVAEHPDLLTPEHIERLRDIALDLEFLNASRGVTSIFAARKPPGNAGSPQPLIPAVLPGDEAFDALRRDILTDSFVGGKLISADGSLTLLVVNLDRQAVANEGLEKAIGDVRAVLSARLRGSDLKVRLTGTPVMQYEIRDTGWRDVLFYNGLGFLSAALVCLFFFRRLSLTLIVIAAPALAVLWSLGALGLMGIRFNLFLTVITPLVTVIAFADSVHFVFTIRRHMRKGRDKLEAVRLAIGEVGPACALTSATAVIALSSFLFAGSALIRTFGLAAAVSALVSFVVVLTLVPVLSLLFLPSVEQAQPHRGFEGRAMRVLHIVAARIGDLLKRWSIPIAGAGYVATIVFGAAYLSLVPHYQLADQLPVHGEARAAAQRLEEKLTGANPVHILIELGAQQTLYSRETLSLVAEAHKLMEAADHAGNEWSLEVLRRWLVDKGETDPLVLKKYVDSLPQSLVRRFIAADERSLLVTGWMPDLDASTLLPVVRGLERQLGLLRLSHPDYQMAVTGLPAIAARNSQVIIADLGLGLMSTIAVTIGLITLAFRSFYAGLASVIPSLLPVFSAGGLLYGFGDGLQFASVVALTVAFALGVDGNIHFLNRLHLEALAGRRDPLMLSVHLVGPALMLTTIVLGLVLAASAFSGLPSLHQFGWLSAVTLLAALIGNMLLLPATLLLEDYILGNNRDDRIKA